jgi:molybdate/tungstate transport system substrate-binding protein
MTIAYTPKSLFANEINATNWPDIFLRNNVKIGHSNPNIDPCGYRAILVTQLAEKYYHKPKFFQKLLGYKAFYHTGGEDKKRIIVRPKETDLLALLEAHAIDYLFIYKSVARQHGLQYITLPPEISLKSSSFNTYYQQAQFKITGKKPGEYIVKKGAAMVYGMTIPQNEKCPNNPKGAVAFINFVLSEKGKNIIEQNGQGVITPPIITGDTSILKEP